MRNSRQLKECYKFWVEDADFKIPAKEFDLFRDALDYAKDGLVTFIHVTPYRDGMCCDDEDQICWRWDDTCSDDEACRNIEKQFPNSRCCPTCGNQICECGNLSESAAQNNKVSSLIYRRFSDELDKADAYISGDDYTIDLSDIKKDKALISDIIQYVKSLGYETYFDSTDAQLMVQGVGPSLYKSEDDEDDDSYIGDYQLAEKLYAGIRNKKLKNKEIDEGMFSNMKLGNKINKEFSNRLGSPGSEIYGDKYGINLADASTDDNLIYDIAKYAKSLGFETEYTPDDARLVVISKNNLKNNKVLSEGAADYLQDGDLGLSDSTDIEVDVIDYNPNSSLGDFDVFAEGIIYIYLEEKNDWFEKYKITTDKISFPLDDDWFDFKYDKLAKGVEEKLKKHTDYKVEDYELEDIDTGRKITNPEEKRKILDAVPDLNPTFELAVANGIRKAIAQGYLDAPEMYDHMEHPNPWEPNYNDY